MHAFHLLLAFSICAKLTFASFACQLEKQQTFQSFSCKKLIKMNKSEDEKTKNGCFSELTQLTLGEGEA